MTDLTAIRLDTRDLAVESEWEHQYILWMDEFTKDGTTVVAQYTSEDAIVSITRSRPNRAEETFFEDSPGKNDRLRLWLTDRPSAVVARSGAGLFEGLKIQFERGNPWVPQDFLDAVECPSDRAFLRRILELAQVNSRLPAEGDYGHHLCFGQSPGGWMHVYPFMRRFPTYRFKVEAGQLNIAGCWTKFKAVAANPGFEELATMLGLDHTGRASWIPVAGLDPDQLWEVGERVSRAINS